VNTATNRALRPRTLPRPAEARQYSGSWSAPGSVGHLLSSTAHAWHGRFSSSRHCNAQNCELVPFRGNQLRAVGSLRAYRSPRGSDRCSQPSSAEGRRSKSSKTARTSFRLGVAEPFRATQSTRHARAQQPRSARPQDHPYRYGCLLRVGGAAGQYGLARLDSIWPVELKAAPLLIAARKSAGSDV
jgi:hypothetical protein